MMNEEERNFYQQSAIAAMQGIQESGFKIEGFAAMLMPTKMAEVAFNIADAMLSEYRKRLPKKQNTNSNEEWLKKKQLEFNFD